MLHVISVHENGSAQLQMPLGPTGRMSSPLLVVRYLHATVSSLSPEVLDSISAGLRLRPPGTMQQAIGAEVEEVRLLAKMLNANRARLLPDFVAGASRELPVGWRVSVLQPVQKQARKGEVAACPVCGKPGQKTCVRCKQQRYCSAECQRAHWQIHKLTCRAPDEEGVELATVSIATAQADAELDLQVAQMQGMTLFSASSQSALGASKASMFNFDGADEDALRNKMLPFKLQVPLSASDSDSAGRTRQQLVQQGLQPLDPTTDPRGIAIMVYDQRRRLQFKVFPSACPQHAKLVHMIRTRGVNGLKAYFSAYVTPARELKIVMSDVLPPQPW